MIIVLQARKGFMPAHGNNQDRKKWEFQGYKYQEGCEVAEPRLHHTASTKALCSGFVLVEFVSLMPLIMTTLHMHTASRRMSVSEAAVLFKHSDGRTPR